MRKKIIGIDILVIIIILLLMLVTIAGICSFRTDRGYTVTNQYGEDIKIFGYGIYAHDSYFKAPIFIGSDLTILIFVIPAMVVSLILEIRKRTVKTKLFLASLIGAVLYYAVSIAFGVTYNKLLLAYIALMSASLFTLIGLIRGIRLDELRKNQKWELPSSGINAFLIISGVGLFAAWLPDILGAVVKGTTLSNIEVYTTEITYVIDLGVVSPLMFICLHLMRKKDGLGDVILADLLTTCVIIGIMLPMQTVFQLVAGIVIPVPDLVTKAGIFVLLALFAVFYEIKLFKNLKA